MFRIGEIRFANLSFNWGTTVYAGDVKRVLIVAAFQVTGSTRYIVIPRSTREKGKYGALRSPKEEIRPPKNEEGYFLCWQLITLDSKDFLSTDPCGFLPQSRLEEVRQTILKCLQPGSTVERAAKSFLGGRPSPCVWGDVVEYVSPGRRETGLCLVLGTERVTDVRTQVPIVEIVPAGPPGGQTVRGLRLRNRQAPEAPTYILLPETLRTVDVALLRAKQGRLIDPRTIRTALLELFTQQLRPFISDREYSEWYNEQVESALVRSRPQIAAIWIDSLFEKFNGPEGASPVPLGIALKPRLVAGATSLALGVTLALLLGPCRPDSRPPPLAPTGSGRGDLSASFPVYPPSKGVRSGLETGTLASRSDVDGDELGDSDPGTSPDTDTPTTQAASASPADSQPDVPPAPKQPPITFEARGFADHQKMPTFWYGRRQDDPHDDAVTRERCDKGDQLACRDVAVDLIYHGKYQKSVDLLWPMCAKGDSKACELAERVLEAMHRW